eukprot:scaffold34631_cov251-Amphora_coffeaeformis.AAC.8
MTTTLDNKNNFSVHLSLRWTVEKHHKRQHKNTLRPKDSNATYTSHTTHGLSIMLEMDLVSVFP